jgi:hypothetical protein
MTHKEKINYLRVATALAGYNFKNKDLDLILELHSLVLKNEGEGSLYDVITTMADINDKYEERKPIILEQNLKFEVYPNDLGEHNWEDAKKVCEDLRDGWRLPTREELHLMWLNRENIGGFADAYYWSSSEYNNFYAWSQYFYNGYQNYYNNNYPKYVRAVRERNVNDIT